MTKKKRASRPDWDAIKKYVGGQLKNERERTNDRIEKTIETDSAANLEALTKLIQQVEILALEIEKHVNN